MKIIDAVDTEDGRDVEVMFICVHSLSLDQLDSGHVMFMIIKTVVQLVESLSGSERLEVHFQALPY